MAIVSLLAQIVVLRHTFIVLLTITALVRDVFVVGRCEHHHKYSYRARAADMVMW